jgi:hypothetical protein
MILTTRENKKPGKNKMSSDDNDPLAETKRKMGILA